MDAEKSNEILIDVQGKLLEVMDIIKELPQGYQFKVREMLSCAETVVSMYNDIQNGIIPDILKDGVNINTRFDNTENQQSEVQEEPPVESKKTVIDLRGINIDIWIY